MTCEKILEKLKLLSNPKNVAEMARFGINPKNTLGVRVPFLRKLAKEIGKDHKLAHELWESNIHEARILASMVDDPTVVTERQMEKWVKDFDSWDVCDQVCSSLFDKTEFSYKKAFEWPERKEEFVRRAGFVLMAVTAVHDKTAKDKNFIQFFPLIKKYSTDERNFVKKAVNWALRQIGKRNLKLNKEAIRAAKEIKKINSKSAKWIARDVLRELQDRDIQKRLSISYNLNRTLTNNTRG